MSCSPTLSSMAASVTPKREGRREAEHFFGARGGELNLPFQCRSDADQSAGPGVH